MKKVFFSLVASVILLTVNLSYAQNSTVNVNMATGAASVNIPIYTVNSGQVSVPISLNYIGSGVKPKDVEGTAGMGWQLNAGGEIRRVVRGLPDDCTQDNNGDLMTGWMSTNNTSTANYASTFTVTNNGTCATGSTDVNNILTNIGNGDTEPDIFYLNAPGLYCELIYDRTSAQFHPVNYQDIQISYNTVGGTGYNSGDIASFTIINDKGIKYVFAAPESVKQTTVVGGTYHYFTLQFERYFYGITYNDAWNLVSMTDACGNGVLFNYQPTTARNSSDPVELFLGSSTQSLQYVVKQTVTPQILSSIVTTNINTSFSTYTYLGFVWNVPQQTVQTGNSVIELIEGMGRYFQFNYAQVAYATNGYTRAFLTGFSDKGCSSPINYQFSYIGVTPSSGTTALPDSTSNQLDYWGYYSSSASTTTLLPTVYINPSNSSYPRYNIAASTTPGSAYIYNWVGSNRAVTANTVTYGSLSTISYAEGGTTTIGYEPNTYYDAPSGLTVQGGGIRVNQIVDNPGNGATNTITRNYTYGTGYPITLPQFAFTMPYSGTVNNQASWNSATALSAYDLSSDDHTILYSSSKITQTGAGSTVYNYSVPGTYWNSSSTPACSSCTTAEWYPTVNYVGTTNCTVNNGPVANLTYSYPFVPNPNYDFERGLPLSIISYNDAGQEVSESDFTYQRSYSPSAISAFKYEPYTVTSEQMGFYSKYPVYYNTSELIATVTKKIFDSSGGGTFQSSVTNYNYGSNYHKLLTQEQVNNSDNSTVTTNYKYVKDFPAAASGSNANVTALYNLRLKNINAPVETYQQITRGTNSPVTTAANLELYSASINGATTNYLPSQQLRWLQPNGATFSPLNVTASSLTHDGGYVPTDNFDIYDNTGYLLTADNTYNIFETTYHDFISNKPTATFKNAQYNQVAFNDFDSQFATPAKTFTISGSGSYTSVGSHAGNAAGMAASTQTFTSGTITKNPLAKYYIFSVWINATTAGSLFFTGITAPSMSYLGNSTWTYYETKILASSLPATFNLAFSSNQNISVDDILLYPDVSEVSTATYDATAHYKLAETNTNGVSSYFTNDTWGRVIFAFDQDHNIVKKNTYITPADIASYNPVISYNSITETYAQTGFNITGPDACSEAGATVTWAFGDGVTTTAALNASVSHAYLQTGTKSVTATVNSPLFGIKNLGPVTVTVNPQVVRLSYNNYTTAGGNITSVIFTNNGSGPSYNFNGTTLPGATVQPGSYTITVYLTGGTQYNPSTGTGYSAVYLNGDCTSACSNFVSSKVSSYTFNLNLSTCTTLAFTVSEFTCSQLEGGGEE